MPRPRKPTPPPRRRRTAEEARAAILDAAERRLVAAGAAGIRLQDVAAEVGVSHPTVLHHFGSREALVQAVATRALDGLHAGLLAALAEAPAGEDQVAALLDGVYEALRARGHGRALLWLAMEGHAAAHDELRLRELAEALHGLRQERYPGRAFAVEDTRFTVVLAASALLAHSVLGEHLLRDAGIADAKGPARFRAWLARRLLQHLEQPSTPDARG